MRFHLSTYEIQNVLKRAESLEISSQFQPYSGVEIITGLQDDQGEEIIYRAGDDSGRILTIENPWGTQAQANNILEQIRGFTYQPYTAERALIDPAAELGDGISVNNVYSGIYEMTKDYTPMLPTDASAPQSEEIDHEYPYESMADRSIERRFSAMESEFRIQSSEISAKVSKTDGSGSVAWSLTSNGWAVYANGVHVFNIDQYGAAINGWISATSGKIGGFDIGATAISYNGLTWNGTRNGIYLGTSGIQIGNKNGAYFQASATGDVKANNMTLTGTLNVGGSTISAANLRSGAVGGNNWSGAKTGYGYATDIWSGSFHGQNTSYFGQVQTYVLTHYGTKREYRPITITINGTSYSVWGVRL